MNEKEKKLYSAIYKVRTCFNNLRSLAESILGDSEVNPSMRAVMEVLSLKDCQTVPQIARSRGVSRQHIQLNMNALLEMGFVDSLGNPRNRRSPLYSLSKKGAAEFAEIRELESDSLRRLAGGLEAGDIDDLNDLLKKLNQNIVDLLENKHDQTPEQSR